MRANPEIPYANLPENVSNFFFNEVVAFYRPPQIKVAPHERIWIVVRDETK